MGLAISRVKEVPGAMIAVPSAAPLGIGPTSALEKRSASSDSVMARRVSVLYTIVGFVDKVW
jgi:hypothetical protein